MLRDFHLCCAVWRALTPVGSLGPALGPPGVRAVTPQGTLLARLP